MNNETFLRQIKNQKKHWWFQGRKNIIDKIIFRINFKKKINILDFGSGSGVNIEILTKYGKVDLQEKNKIARLNLKRIKNFERKINIFPIIILVNFFLTTDFDKFLDPK